MVPNLPMLKIILVIGFKMSLIRQEIITTDWFISVLELQQKRGQLGKGRRGSRVPKREEAKDDQRTLSYAQTGTAFYMSEPLAGNHNEIYDIEVQF